MHVPGKRRRAAKASDLGGREHVGLEIGAKPAIRLGDADGEQAGLVQVPIVLRRKLRHPGRGRSALGANLVGGKLTGAGDDVPPGGHQDRPRQARKSGGSVGCIAQTSHPCISRQRIPDDLAVDHHVYCRQD